MDKDPKKYNVFYFSLGMAFGMIFGVMVAIFLFNRYNENLKSLLPDFSHDQKVPVSDPLYAEPVHPVEKEKPSFETVGKVRSVGESDSIHKSELSVRYDTVLFIDSLLDALEAVDTTTEEEMAVEVHEKPHSIKSNQTTVQSQEVVVLRDRLMHTRNIEVRSTDSVGQRMNIDSLLFDKDDQRSAETTRLTVEFWRSPVNYTGYRLTGKRLVLFGIFEFDSVFLYREGEKKFRMNYKDEIFILANTEDFLPLLPVAKEKQNPRK